MHAENMATVSSSHRESVRLETRKIDFTSRQPCITSRRAANVRRAYVTLTLTRTYKCTCTCTCTTARMAAGPTSRTGAAAAAAALVPRRRLLAGLAALARRRRRRAAAAAAAVAAVAAAVAVAAAALPRRPARPAGHLRSKHRSETSPSSPTGSEPPKRAWNRARSAWRSQNAAHKGSRATVG